MLHAESPAPASIPFVTSSPAFWGLDPSFWSPMLLLMRDIKYRCQPSEDWPDVYFYLNHPLKSVEVLGLVVGIDRKTRHVIYSVDDGSDVMPVVQWEKDQDDQQEDQYATGASMPIFPVGRLVRACGRLCEYRDQRQITAQTMVAVCDPNAEAHHLARCLYLRKNVYDIPFQLPASVLGLRAEIEQALAIKVHASAAVSHTFHLLQEMNIDALPENECTESTFKVYLHYRMSQLDRECPFQQLHQDAQLLSLAERVLRMQFGAKEADAHRIMALFTRSLRALVDEGYIYLQDEIQDVYDTISHERNLGKDVLHLIQDGTRQLDVQGLQTQLQKDEGWQIPSSGNVSPELLLDPDAAGPTAEPQKALLLGVKEDYIVARIQALPRYAKVTRLQIQQSIQRWIAESLVFESNYKEYRSLS